MLFMKKNNGLKIKQYEMSGSFQDRNLQCRIPNAALGNKLKPRKKHRPKVNRMMTLMEENTKASPLPPVAHSNFDEGPYTTSMQHNVFTGMNTTQGKFGTDR